MIDFFNVNIEEAIALRGDKKRDTLSGACIGLLRRLAREKRIGEIARSCERYFEEFSSARDFVASRLPALLFENYPPLIYDKERALTARWTQQHDRDWVEEIKENADSAGLESVISELVSQLQDYVWKSDESTR